MCQHLPLPTRCCALQADLVKDGGHHYFISSLDVAEPGMSADSRAQAAFVLAVICDGHRRGRSVCAEQGLLQKLLSLLSSMVRASLFKLRLPLPASQDRPRAVQPCWRSYAQGRPAAAAAPYTISKALK